MFPTATQPLQILINLFLSDLRSPKQGIRNFPWYSSEDVINFLSAVSESESDGTHSDSESNALLSEISSKRMSSHHSKHKESNSDCSIYSEESSNNDFTKLVNKKTSHSKMKKSKALTESDTNKKVDKLSIGLSNGKYSVKTKSITKKSGTPLEEKSSRRTSVKKSNCVLNEQKDALPPKVADQSYEKKNLVTPRLVSSKQKDLVQSSRAKTEPCNKKKSKNVEVESLDTKGLTKPLRVCVEKLSRTCLQTVTLRRVSDTHYESSRTDTPDSGGRPRAVRRRLRDDFESPQSGTEPEPATRRSKRKSVLKIG